MINCLALFIGVAEARGIIPRGQELLQQVSLRLCSYVQRVPLIAFHPQAVERDTCHVTGTGKSIWINHFRPLSTVSREIAARQK